MREQVIKDRFWLVIVFMVCLTCIILVGQMTSCNVHVYGQRQPASNVEKEKANP